MTTIARGDETAAATHRRLPFRPDIDGLRGLAIVGVVLYHAHVPFASGGFLGVDVFFVISGFLITAQLVDPTGGIGGRRLLEFWARRIRRLLPAMTVMIVATTAAMLLVLAPSDAELWAPWTAASALYVPNLAMAVTAGDYFRGPLLDFPLLHTWSLGVEEQFYVAWPLLLAGAGVLRAGAQAAGARRTRATAVIGAVFLASFATSIWLADTAAAWAFYGPHARAWQFATGAMLAVGPLRAPAARSATAATTVGLVAIVGSFVAFSSERSHPGLAALVPTVGTALVLWSGNVPARRSPRALLAAEGPQRLGRLAYSLYLYHWPAMVLLTVAANRDTVPVRLAAAALAVPVAAASLRWVENPIRRSARLATRPATTFALGVALTVVSLAAAGTLHVVGGHRGRQEPYRTWEAARQGWREPPCDPRTSPSGIEHCEAGDADGAATLMLVGDSHVTQWLHVIADVAESEGIRVIGHAEGNCSPIPPPDPDAVSFPAECLTWHRDTWTLIDDFDPTAVVMVEAETSRERHGSARRWAAGLGTHVERLERDGRRVGLIRTVPQAGDPLLCLARLRSEERCAPGPEILEKIAPYGPAERRLAAGGVPVLDVVPDICPSGRCRMRTPDGWVFSSDDHLTVEFTTAHRDEVAEFLAALTR